MNHGSLPLTVVKLFGDYCQVIIWLTVVMFSVTMHNKETRLVCKMKIFDANKTC